jgi:hypothetical protein
MSSKVTLYKNLYDTVGVPVELNSVLRGIHDGRWRKGVLAHREGKIDGKKVLPCFAVGGVFKPTRSNDNCVESSCYMSIDLDDVDSKFRVDFIYSSISKYVEYDFQSLSGNGVCLLVKIPPTTDLATYKRRYASFYNELIAIGLEEHCKVDKLSDLSRLRFISYSNVYYNVKAEVFEGMVDVEEVEQKNRSCPTSRIEFEERLLSDTDAINVTVSKYEEAVGAFGNGSITRHDWVLGLGRWLCRSGVDEESAVFYIQSNYVNNDRPNGVWEREVNRAVKSSYRRYASEAGTFKPTKYFDYNDINNCTNIEEVLTQFIYYIGEKENLLNWLVDNNKDASKIKKEIEFLKVFYKKVDDKL